MTHACLLVAAGSLLGGALAVVLGWSLDRFFPTVSLTLLPIDLVEVVAVFAAAGVVGAVTPVWRLRRIDPLDAFRA